MGVLRERDEETHKKLVLMNDQGARRCEEILSVKYPGAHSSSVVRLTTAVLLVCWVALGFLGNCRDLTVALLVSRPRSRVPR